MRLAACLGVALDIIEPCGFPLTDKALRRAAMDYGQWAEIVRHDGWASFTDSATTAGDRLVLFSTRGRIALQDFRFQPSDRLLFGSESMGAPTEVHDKADAIVLIPMRPEARSLNVATAAGIALWEALRQTRALAKAG